MSTDIESVPAVGTAMPDIDLVGPDGLATTLQQVRAGQRAVVYFLRAATCPVCVNHARTLTDLATTGDLGNNVRVVLVAPGEPLDAAELARRIGNDTVGSWASGSGHEAAGLGSFLALQHSGTFLVNADGTVAYRRTATLPPNSFSRRELLKALGR
ncbi:redoxin family protein [Streptomyces sp. NPDC008092]|uniref:peroxiredoxin family protein n=1 Tax=Streptomyces sp. NPDC008092 TaxID=3364808 RepID=UPI0036F08C08